MKNEQMGVPVTDTNHVLLILSFLALLPIAAAGFWQEAKFLVRAVLSTLIGIFVIFWYNSTTPDSATLVEGSSHWAVAIILTSFGVFVLWSTLWHIVVAAVIAVFLFILLFVGNNKIASAFNATDGEMAAIYVVVTIALFAGYWLLSRWEGAHVFISTLFMGFALVLAVDVISQENLFQTFQNTSLNLMDVTSTAFIVELCILEPIYLLYFYRAKVLGLTAPSSPPSSVVVRRIESSESEDSDPEEDTPLVFSSDSE